MFNRQSVYFNSGDSHTNIKVNAVSGGIVKNHATSYFMRFNLKSTTSERLLSPSPFRRRVATWQEKEEYKKKNNYPNLEHIDVPVEVLQMVVVGDMEVVAECIDIIEQGNKTEGEHEV